MKTTTVKPFQSLFDLALQEYGDVEGVFWLAEDNGLHGVLDNLAPGQELKVRDSAINVRMRDYLRPFEIATAEGARGEGIGFWAVGIDFEVS